MQRFTIEEVETNCSHLQDFQGVRYYEHAVYGDEAPVIAIYDGVAWMTTFYDPFNLTDTMYVLEELDEAKACEVYTKFEDIIYHC